MKNRISSGAALDVVAPANVASGALVVVGTNIFGVALADAVSAASVAIQTGGVYSLRALNGASTSAAVGANAHWDATNSNVTISATSNLKIGVFVAAKANADTLATVRLNDVF